MHPCIPFREIYSDPNDFYDTERFQLPMRLTAIETLTVADLFALAEYFQEKSLSDPFKFRTKADIVERQGSRDQEHTEMTPYAGDLDKEIIDATPTPTRAFTPPGLPPFPVLTPAAVPPMFSTLPIHTTVTTPTVPTTSVVPAVAPCPAEVMSGVGTQVAEMSTQVTTVPSQEVMSGVGTQEAEMSTQATTVLPTQKRKRGRGRPKGEVKTADTDISINQGMTRKSGRATQKRVLMDAQESARVSKKAKRRPAWTVFAVQHDGRVAEVDPEGNVVGYAIEVDGIAVRVDEEGNCTDTQRLSNSVLKLIQGN